MSFKPALTLALGLALLIGCGSVSLVPGGGKSDGGAGQSGGGGGAGGGVGLTGAGGSTTGAAGSTTGGAGATGGAGTGTAGAGGAAGSPSCVCDTLYAPVCGTDGVTYGNDCEAMCAGATVAYAGACDAADGGGDASSSDAGKSDTITLRLDVPTSQSYCDMTTSCDEPTHVTIMTSARVVLVLDEPACSTTCSTTCRPSVCPEIACLSRGVAYTGGEITWDRTVYDMSTCGSGVACYSAKKAAVGRYIARMCATPGTLSTSDAGISRTTCTATGPEQCIEVPFDIPGPTPVVGTLR